MVHAREPLSPRSPASRALEGAIHRASRVDRPVFLLGSSGTGKMYAAHLLHELSGAKGSFVYVNSGGLPADRTHLHSQLLGHLKGAFTGATDKRVGLLFEADGGTLFLDEVESLVPEAQVFLLDLLEGREDLVPLGASTSRALPRPAWILFFGTFLNKFGAFVVPFLTLYLTGRGYTVGQVGLVVGAYGVGNLLASLLGGHLADRLGRRGRGWGTGPTDGRGDRRTDPRRRVHPCPGRASKERGY